MSVEKIIINTFVIATNNKRNSNNNNNNKGYLQLMVLKCD